MTSFVLFVCYVGHKWLEKSAGGPLQTLLNKVICFAKLKTLPRQPTILIEGGWPGSPETAPAVRKSLSGMQSIPRFKTQRQKV